MRNITNTWGTFDGHHGKWHEFRDRFKAAVHDNAKIKTVFKFSLLKAAMVGSAAGAVGSRSKQPDLDYARAWDRLNDLYEDDYMVKQSHAALREILDTVHQCMGQLGNFIDIQGWEPMILFILVDLLDKSTYEAWEMHRQTMIDDNMPQGNAPENDAEAGNAAADEAS